MAFKNTLSDRIDEFGLASPRSSFSESIFSTFPSPPGPQTSYPSAIGHDVRSTIQRRFTTDSTKLPPWVGVGTASQPPLPESLDILSSATRLHKSHHLIEKKRQHIEYMREQKKRFEADLKLLDLQQEKEEQEMDQLTRNLAHTGLPGPVSEPTTPPEYHESGFPTILSRPARFSISNGQPPALYGNGFSTSSQVTSPVSTHTNSTFGGNNHESITTSAMNSRRNSEHDPHHSGAFSAYRPKHLTRYSLATSTFQPSHKSNGFGASMGFNSFYSHKHSLDEDDDKPKDEDRMSTPDVKSYLRMTDPDDKFPTLIRHDHDPSLLSANPAAIDLANSRTPVPENYRGNARHHSAHQSLPHNSLAWFQVDNSNDKPQTSTTTATFSPGNYTSRHSSHLSLEGTLPSLSSAPSVGHQNSRPTSLQMSFSTNDVPTVRNGGFHSNRTSPGSIDEQIYSHSNGSIGMAHQASRSTHSASETPPTPQSERTDSAPKAPSLQPGFQGTPASTSFQPQVNAPATASVSSAGPITPGMQAYPNQGYPYGIQPFVPNSFQANGNHVQGFPMQPPFGQPFTPYSRFAESPGRPNQVRRNGEAETGPFSRFANVPLEHYRGELYSLCKDQHGCRYLQRKLEERNAESVQLIFLETHMHVVELMTDPFGNYLCQKLLEYSNDEQRTALINHAAPQLVQIAFNQHGTRALQKMIEFISTPEQTQTVIDSLRDKVVDLVQDLNGNHVIQKCLNRLSASDAQFIYDAVGASCVSVGTHRHGCCVLQRCIDHASGEQRARLISQITGNSFALVQDPFGNYVVQYILDLAEPHFTEPLCQTFLGSVAMLSKQKFSSNVIEKCLRTADFQVRRLLILEMLSANSLEMMLRDSFANYVVQTAMDYADPETRTALIEAIRPILPVIRQTPHGRRIAGKIMSIDSQSRVNGNGSGQLTPSDENRVYHQSHGFSAPSLSQFAPQLQAPDALSVSSSTTTPVGAESSTAGVPATPNGDNPAATIYCPVPQQGSNLLNGINGTTTPGFSLY